MLFLVFIHKRLLLLITGFEKLQDAHLNIWLKLQKVFFSGSLVEYYKTYFTNWRVYDNLIGKLFFLLGMNSLFLLLKNCILS